MIGGGLLASLAARVHYCCAAAGNGLAGSDQRASESFAGIVVIRKRSPTWAESPHHKTLLDILATRILTSCAELSSTDWILCVPFKEPLQRLGR